MGKINYMKWGKLIVGTVSACLIAKMLGLQFFTAAGIITLLSIQDTRKETFVIATKRLLIFAIMTLLSMVIFPLAGYNVMGFGMVLVPYLFFCLALKMPEAIAPIAVLCTHYMSVGNCSLQMILNEFFILFIGAGTGVVLNLFIPSNKKKILRFQRETDESIIRILHRMSVYLLEEDKSDYTGSCFEELEKVLDALQKEARRQQDNQLFFADPYALEYMQMRFRQCKRLQEIYGDIMKIDHIVDQAKPLSEFLEIISRDFSEDNDVEALLSEAERIGEEYRNSELPKSREEFETRAILFDILTNLKIFLQIKREFIRKPRG